MSTFGSFPWASECSRRVSLISFSFTYIYWFSVLDVTITAGEEWVVCWRLTHHQLSQLQLSHPSAWLACISDFKIHENKGISVIVTPHTYTRITRTNTVTCHSITNTFSWSGVNRHSYIIFNILTTQILSMKSPWQPKTLPSYQTAGIFLVKSICPFRRSSIKVQWHYINAEELKIRPLPLPFYFLGNPIIILF